MNAVTQIDVRDAVAGRELVERPQLKIVQPLRSDRRSRLVRRAGCGLVSAAALGGAGYFFATASLAIILSALGVLLAIFCMLVGSALYVMDHVE
jgi:hypothetical protein